MRRGQLATPAPAGKSRARFPRLGRANDGFVDGIVGSPGAAFAAPIAAPDAVQDGRSGTIRELVRTHQHTPLAGETARHEHTCERVSCFAEKENVKSYGSSIKR
jgi:hypothetical protein